MVYFKCLYVHGRRKEFFQGGPLVDFSKSFSRGDKNDEIWFLPAETKKTTFLLNFSNSCPSSDTYTCV